MRYLNVKTGRQATEFIDDETTIIDSDPRVSFYFERFDPQQFDVYLGEDGWPVKKEYETDVNGLRFPYYLDEPVDGVFRPDLKAIREVSVPKEVTRAQGKYALHKFGYMPAVLTFMETLPESVKYAADLAFNDTLTWKRDSPFMQTMCDGVGLTDEQVDELFIYASKVEL